MLIEPGRFAWRTPAGCHVSHSPTVRGWLATLHPAGVRTSRGPHLYKHCTPLGCPALRRSAVSRHLGKAYEGGEAEHYLLTELLSLAFSYYEHFIPTGSSGLIL